MQVVRDGLGLDAEHVDVQLEVDAEGPVGELGVEVAEVRRHERFARADDAEGALDLRSGRHDRSRGNDGGRILMSWVFGALIVLGTFNHAVVSMIEIVLGMRYGAAVSVGDLFSNLGLAVGGNLLGGLVFVTFARSVQALAPS
jgi:hypothetical protein